MEFTHKVRVEDATKIKSIHFKCPELMAENSVELIKEEYGNLLKAKDALYEAREKVRALEKMFSTLEDKWNAKKDLFDIEFESHEKEVKVVTSHMTINGKTVYDCNTRR